MRVLLAEDDKRLGKLIQYMLGRTISRWNG